MSRPFSAKIARLGAGSTHDAAAKGESAPNVSGPSSPETLSAMLVAVALTEQVAALNAARKAANFSGVEASSVTRTQKAAEGGLVVSIGRLAVKRRRACEARRDQHCD